MTAVLKFAGYIRISDEKQIGNHSLEAQTRAIQDYVASKGGILTTIYVDEAETARTTKNRDAFLQMRQDARKKCFDALVVHKFDRLNRNRMDAMAVKALLRRDFGVKVFSVTEPGEDSDGAMGALLEGIMESIAEWYSRNLSDEFAKGMRQRAIKGIHHNTAPFGYIRQGKDLIPAVDEYKGVILLFEAFATQKYSYADVGNLLNEAGYRTKAGRLFTRDTIVEMLQNITYVGKIKHQRTTYTADGKRTYTAPIEIYEGKHQPLISQELFDQCQQVRQNRNTRKTPKERKHSYLLRGLLHCGYCHERPNKPLNSFGKMICHTKGDGKSFYRCASRWQGWGCEQTGVQTESIDQQVIDALLVMKPPAEWRAKVAQEIAQTLGAKTMDARIGEIRKVIENMDFRWDSGFITDKDDYARKRQQLQIELDSLQPFADDVDNLALAADMLANFPKHWRACGDDIVKRHELIKKIVDRIYVKDQLVVSMVLKADYHIVLNGSVTTEGVIKIKTPANKQELKKKKQKQENQQEQVTKSGRRDSNP